jgi:hypothetical protein
MLMFAIVLISFPMYKLCMIQQYTYLFLVMVAASHVASDNLVPFVLGVGTDDKNGRNAKNWTN